MSTGSKPRIVKLRKEEVDRVLPWTGSGEQRLQKLGGPSTWMARVAVSLAGTLLLCLLPLVFVQSNQESGGESITRSSTPSFMCLGIVRLICRVALVFEFPLWCGLGKMIS